MRVSYNQPIPQTHQSLLVHVNYLPPRQLSETTDLQNHPMHTLEGERPPRSAPLQHNSLAESLATIASLPGTAHLTSQEAALYLRTSSAVLRVWRSRGQGPRYRGRGHFVRYTKADLDAYMAGFDHRFDHTEVAAQGCPPGDG